MANTGPFQYQLEQGQFPEQPNDSQAKSSSTPVIGSRCNRTVDTSQSSIAGSQMTTETSNYSSSTGHSKMGQGNARLPPEPVDVVTLQKWNLEELGEFELRAVSSISSYLS
jgi:hypothetical protein